MKKIIQIFIITLIFSITNLASTAPTMAKDLDKQVGDYCTNGDKILNYYEKLEDKSNGPKYLNAAKYYYYQAARLDLSNQNSLIGIARINLFQNKTREAKNVLMIALNYNELNPRVSYYLGEAFFMDGEYTQAIDFYMWAYSHGYRYDHKTNMKLGICYEKLDDVKKAKYHYTNAIKADPNCELAINRLNGLNEIKIDKNIEIEE